MTSNYLYKFYQNYGYGCIEGLFIADENEVNKLYGQTIHLGDVLGKHSEVYIEITKDNLLLISTDTELCANLIYEFGGKLLCGYNPLYYIEQDS